MQEMARKGNWIAGDPRTSTQRVGKRVVFSEAADEAEAIGLRIGADFDRVAEDLHDVALIVTIRGSSLGGWRTL